MNNKQDPNFKQAEQSRVRQSTFVTVENLQNCKNTLTMRYKDWNETP